MPQEIGNVSKVLPGDHCHIVDTEIRPVESSFPDRINGSHNCRQRPWHAPEPLIGLRIKSVDREVPGSQTRTNDLSGLLHCDTCPHRVHEYKYSRMACPSPDHLCQMRIDIGVAPASISFFKL